jgi:hypothetical protein
MLAHGCCRAAGSLGREKQVLRASASFGLLPALIRSLFALGCFEAVAGVAHASQGHTPVSFSQTQSRLLLELLL